MLVYCDRYTAVRLPGLQRKYTHTREYDVLHLFVASNIQMQSVDVDNGDDISWNY